MLPASVRHLIEVFEYAVNLNGSGTLNMRRTKEEAEKTRTRILEVAEELFFQKGVANTSLEQIARAAGVTRGAVYWHFANKSDLFYAMLSQVHSPTEVLSERLQQQCNLHEPLRPLRDLCVEAVESLREDTQKRRIWTILMHRCENTDELRPALEQQEAFAQQIIEVFEQQFTKAHQNGLLSPEVTPQQAAYALETLTRAQFMGWTREGVDLDQVCEPSVLFDALFRGLIPGWAPSKH